MTKSFMEQEFTENGFIVVRNLFNKDEVNSYLKSLEEVIQQVNTTKSYKYRIRYTLNNKEEYDTWGVNEIYCPDLYRENLGHVLANKEILDICSELLDTKELRYWGAHALWSPVKKDYTSAWHRDGLEQNKYTCNGKSNHVQFTLALVPDSCFKIVPGSHRRPLTECEKKQVENKGTDKLPGELTVYLNPGDIVFVNSDCLHRGECNIHTERKTLHFNLQAKDEPTGGNVTKPWMEDPEYMKNINPTIRQLIENLVQWDKENVTSNNSFACFKKFNDSIRYIEK